ncbi:MAG: OmpA family protein [Deltaproteobacteria bacterium]|nr:OmpA family protein [Deltaproteobacteria bacterium]MCB9787551.1 OmpA family protein [Deltaproteobacteria bacterium]
MTNSPGRPRGRTAGRWPALVAVAVVGLGGLLAGGARAQTVIRTGVDAQQFEAGPGQRDILGVTASGVGQHLGWRAGVLAHLGHRPLTLERGGGSVRLIENQLTLDILGSIGLLERLEIGVVLPVTPWQTGDASAAFPFDTGGDLEGAGLGDLRATLKVLLFGQEEGFRLALSGEFRLPTGDTDLDMSDGALVVTPLLLLGYTLPSGLRFELEAGARLRKKRQVLDLTVGHEIVYGLGVHAPLGSLPLALRGTIQGAVGLEDSDAAARPLEVLGALAIDAGARATVTVGGGAGLTSGFGTPSWRLFVGVDLHSPEGARHCTTGPEDYDGFEDHDRCADLDNDGDGIEDVDDVCPFESETPNGYVDEDGCPDEVPPGGVPRAGEAGDEGAEPEGDADGDGVSDDADLCPDRAEDADGFEDGDGCPDPDNDQDGIVDAKDKCPLAAEVINGVDDADGCPDTGETKVRVERDRIVILEKVYFASAKAVIQKRSHAVLDQVASVLQANPQVLELRVEGHTDDKGVAARNLALSQARADAVMAYLVSKGVDPARLVAKGYGQTRPVADNKTAAGREENRRVEFHISRQAGVPAQGQP